jgi:ABC-type uncharacterized transport system ATPase subunit
VNDREPLLTAQHLTKRYGTVEALQDASIELFPGTIHGLIGENGAGKSTLMRILAGIEPNDGGDLSVSTTRPIAQAIVPQYPRMAESLPLWQNLLVGTETRRGPFIASRNAIKTLRATADRFGIDLSLEKRTGDLNGTETRLAALLAALVREPNLLILDEPTVGLALTDKEAILKSLATLRSEGIGILLISHDLSEVARVADTVTVLRRGRSIASFSSGVTVDLLAETMLGSASTPPHTEPSDPPERSGETEHGGKRQRSGETEHGGKTQRSGKRERGGDGDHNGESHRSGKRERGGDGDHNGESHRSGERERDDLTTGTVNHTGIRFQDLHVYNSQSDRRIGPLHFIAPSGTITAITGVRESGIDLIEGYLSGESRAVAGSAYIDNRRLSSHIDPGKLRHKGLTYVPSDRFDVAAALDGSVEENAIVQKREEVHPRGIRSSRSSGGVASSLLARFGVSVQHSIPLGALSGGTIQKLILARELEHPTRGCVISEPFAGLDVASQHTLIDIVRSLAREGTAVIVLTSTVDAAVALADEIAVLRDGTLHGPYSPEQSERINRAFAGVLEESS